MRDKHQNIEEPCEGKLSCTVLKTNGVGDNLVEFNDFYVASDNTRVAAPKFLRKTERKLKSAQRRVSRRKKGSNRRKKAIKKLGIQHKKVSDTRKDFHFKTACDSMLAESR